tara:strand:+ start:4654 stop:5433 length:780 start_codon:yes stop_codon:yes gene_type:complete
MGISLKQRLLYLISLSLLICTPYRANASIIQRVKNFLEIPEKLSTKSHWKGCPSQTVGKFVIELVNDFEKNRSLYSVDKKINEERLLKKYFINNYKIKFSPIHNKLTFNLSCPEPLVRVSAINSEGISVSSSILSDDGELYDPTYELLLKSEKLIKGDLPTLAVSYEKLNEKNKNQISDFFISLDKKIKSLMSEMILDENGKMTLILSHKRKPTSVFFGTDNWTEKRIKLTKMIAYLIDRKGLPKTINMTNTKKVVVKF